MRPNTVLSDVKENTGHVNNKNKRKCMNRLLRVEEAEGVCPLSLSTLVGERRDVMCTCERVYAYFLSNHFKLRDIVITFCRGSTNRSFVATRYCKNSLFNFCSKYFC